MQHNSHATPGPSAMWHADLDCTMLVRWFRHACMLLPLYVCMRACMISSFPYQRRAVEAALVQLLQLPQPLLHGAGRGRHDGQVLYMIPIV